MSININDTPSFLPVQSAKDRTIFQKGLYRAFIANPFSKWVQANYGKDDKSQRMWPKSNSFDVESFLLADRKGSPISGFSFNYNCGETALTQFEQIGFKKPSGGEFCEVLHYFNFSESGRNGIKSGNSLREIVICAAGERGINRAYATCPNPRVKKLYEMFGWRTESYIKFNNGTESWLICYTAE
ncbi:MAG: hypothetical protein COB67_06715 [SAR324 cluster bacterium]|uniref:N-acetyltransferase domain-containing protein n=1 Tax=SAR324 cluster bacterium TaxID=2024889 RepID=A0A2A4T5R5_9DELT|nr:MAG: hypothetical protein COB67_06715 [SAR324 cluster bacterium]